MVKKGRSLKRSLIVLIILVCWFLSSEVASSEEKGAITITSNVISLFGLGDFNLRGEYRLNEDHAILVGAHYNPDEERSKKTGKYGFNGAYRMYADLIKRFIPVNDYFQFDAFVEDSYPDRLFNTDESKVVVGFQFWYGFSKRLPKDLTHNLEFGVSRKIQERSKTKLLMAYSIGMTLD